MEKAKKFMFYVAFVASLGGFLFNLFPGVLMEATGSYAVIYVILLVCGVLAAAIILHAYRRYRPEMG